MSWSSGQLGMKVAPSVQLRVVTLLDIAAEVLKRHCKSPFLIWPPGRGMLVSLRHAHGAEPEDFRVRARRQDQGGSLRGVSQ